VGWRLLDEDLVEVSRVGLNSSLPPDRIVVVALRFGLWVHRMRCAGILPGGLRTVDVEEGSGGWRCVEDAEVLGS